MNKKTKELQDKFFKSVDESIANKLTMKYGGIPVKELTFEIINIQSERRINGKTNIRAICLQDDIYLDIEIPNSELNNKSSVKQSLIIEHMRLLEFNKCQNDYIQKGSII